MKPNDVHYDPKKEDSENVCQGKKCIYREFVQCGSHKTLCHISKFKTSPKLNDRKFTKKANLLSR